MTQKITTTWFDDVTTTTDVAQSLRVDETTTWFGGVKTETKNDFGNKEAPPASILTAAGPVQYSADGTSWGNTIPAGSLKVDTQVDFFVRVNPAGTLAADDGTYDYQFKLIPDPAGGTTGIGGLTIVNDSTIQNLAKVSGKVPADQATYKMTIEGKVVDAAGTEKTGTKLIYTWVV